MVMVDGRISVARPPLSIWGTRPPIPVAQIYSLDYLRHDREDLYSPAALPARYI